MRKLLAALCLMTTLQAFSQIGPLPDGFIYDACEAASSTGWGADFRTNYAMVTGGNQSFGNPDPRAYIEVSSSYARKGTKSYKMYVSKRTDYPGCCEWVRSEVMWLSPSQQTKENAWKIAAVSVLIDPSWQFENRPTQIAFDTKAAPDDLQTPFWLGIMNGQYYVDGYFVGGTTYLGPVTKGVFEDWLVERNWYAGPGHPNNVMFGESNGVIRLFRNGVLVFEKYGVNYFGRPGDAAIARLQHGLYKWVWATSGGQGWGEGSPVEAANAPIVAHYDEMYFGFAGNTKEQVFSRLQDEGPPGNLNPTANAGSNQTITLPTTTASLTGSGNDADGTISNYQWTKVSGPAGGAISSPATANTSITSLQAGDYVYRLTVTDDDGAQGIDDVQIIVQASAPAGSNPVFTNINGDVAPTPDKTVQLPKNRDTLIVYAKHTTTTGHIGPFTLTQLAGPNTATVNQFNQTGWVPTRTNFDLSGLIQGTYTFRITATDNSGNVGADTVNVVVQPASNVAPTVDAGTTYRMGFPDANVTITGTASDPDGSIANVRWDKISGPGATIASPTTLSTAVNVPNAGIYVFQLTATDNQGKTASDTMSVIVESVSAGIDTVLIAPAASLTLKSVASNQGSATITWTKVSGGAATIVSPNAANTVVNGLVPGDYIFKVRASYNSGLVFTEDEVSVKVLGTGVTTKQTYILDIQLKN